MGKHIKMLSVAPHAARSCMNERRSSVTNLKSKRHECLSCGKIHWWQAVLKFHSVDFLHFRSFLISEGLLMRLVYMCVHLCERKGVRVRVLQWQCGVKTHSLWRHTGSACRCGTQSQFCYRTIAARGFVREAKGARLLVLCGLLRGTSLWAIAITQRVQLFVVAYQRAYGRSNSESSGS